MCDGSASLHDSIWYNRASFIHSRETVFPHGLGSRRHLIVIKTTFGHGCCCLLCFQEGENRLDMINSLLTVSMEPLLKEKDTSSQSNDYNHLMFQSAMLCMYGSVPISLSQSWKSPVA